MSITADELKADLEKYPRLSENEDIDTRLAMAESLFGVIPNGASLEESREERMRRI